MAEGPATPSMRMVGPSGALEVWLGAMDDRATLEAEVRAVGVSGTGQLSDLAMALGDIARRHHLDVRVITKMGVGDPRLLVFFGPRAQRRIPRR
jgi:hypothetical protein